MGIIEWIQNYVATTPPEVMAAHALFAVGWFPIAGVIIWGMSQLWIDAKQGQYWGNLKWVLLHVNVPQDALQSPKGMENFFNLLAGSKSSITWKEKWLLGKFQAYFSLEIVSVDGRISFYIRTTDKYRDLIEASFYAQYPEAQIAEVDDYFDHIPDEYPDEEYDLWGSEMILKKKSYFPIKTYEMFEHQGEKDLRFKDPILSMLENMGKMRPGETYMIQILIMSPDSQDDWVQEGRKYIEKVYGLEKPKKKGWMADAIGWLPSEVLRQTTGADFLAGAEDAPQQDNFKMFKLTPEERDQLDAIKEKISKVGWMTKIRFVYCAKRELFRKGSIAAMSKGMFHQFTHQNWNKFTIHNASTPKDDYFYMLWQMAKKQTRLIKRYKQRLLGPGSDPYFLNSAELATLFHFPPADARTPVLTSVAARRSEAPLELGFAAEGAAILQNLDRAAKDLPEGTPGVPPRKIEPGPLVVPKIKAPTAPDRGSDNAFDHVKAPESEPTATLNESGTPAPQFGKGVPAPLPPGLDLHDQSLPPAQAPENLPLDRE